MLDILRLRHTFEDSAVGFSMVDASGRFLAANGSYQKLTGYTERELTSRNFQSITHPDDLPNNQLIIKRLFAGEIRSSVYEKRYVLKNGGVRWVRNSASLTPESEGHPPMAIALTENISERREAEAAASAASCRLRQLSTDLLRAQDRERRRIARELHDDTGQLLTALALNLSRMSVPGITACQRDEFLAEALKLANRCSRDLRTLSYVLHPPLLEDFGLVDALEMYAEGFRKRTGIELRLSIPPDFGRLPRDLEITLFRIVQEGLANTHRHSSSPSAVVSLRRDAGEARMEIADRGGGILPTPGVQNAVSMGVGIPGMRERAEILGGSFDVSTGSSGTRLIVTLPLTGFDEEDANTDRR